MLFVGVSIFVSYFGVSAWYLMCSDPVHINSYVVQ